MDNCLSSEKDNLCCTRRVARRKSEIAVLNLICTLKGLCLVSGAITKCLSFEVIIESGAKYLIVYRMLDL